MRLLGHMSRPIVICHDPSHGQKTQEKRERSSPPRAIGEMAEYPACGLQIGCQDEEGHTDRDGCQDVDRREPEDDIVQVSGGEGADYSGADEDGHGEENSLEGGAGRC